MRVSVHDNDWPTPVPTLPPPPLYPPYPSVVGNRDDGERQVDWLDIVVAVVEIQVDDNPAVYQKDVSVNCDDDNGDGHVDKDEEP